MLPAGADPRDSEIRPLWEGPLRLERPPEPECPAERSEHKWGQTSAYNSPHDGGRKCQLCGLEERDDRPDRQRQRRPSQTAPHAIKQSRAQHAGVDWLSPAAAGSVRHGLAAILKAKEEESSMSDESISLIEGLLREVERFTRGGQGGPQGIWLEKAVVDAAPEIRRWGLRRCWGWADWPARERMTQGASAADPGIDCVGERTDGKWVAIQCKARQELDGNPPRTITRHESLKFASATTNKEMWAERWIVTNGFAQMSRQCQDVYQTALSEGQPLKLVSLKADLHREQAIRVRDAIEQARKGRFKQSRDEMQDEAVRAIVSGLEADRLRDFENSHVPPPPQEKSPNSVEAKRSRGRLVLPCGTGKTRIAVRVVESLTRAGDTSAILCPSIGLIGQIRDGLAWRGSLPQDMRILAICSDQDALRTTSSPVALAIRDYSEAKASDITGDVRSDGRGIAEWIKDPQSERFRNVIISTYQSGHRLADGLKNAEKEIRVLVCDEAHRTAGIARPRKIQR